MSHPSIRNGAPSARVLSFSHSRFFFLFFPHSPGLPSAYPNGRLDESDTAQLMATVVAGRAYLAATSHEN